MLFFSVAVMIVYLDWRGGLKRATAIGLLSVALFASNYMAHVALFACLAVDYLFWRKHEQSVQKGEWAALFIPQIIGCGAIAMVRNPLRTQFGEYFASNTLLIG
jgi:hypothetical protein